MLPTLAAAVPLPVVTVQDCVGVAGWVRTVTLYVAPMAIAVLNVNGLLVVIARLSPPLFCRTRPIPSRPTTLPPMERVPVEHVIWTPVTLAIAVPLPPATVQVCGGVEGGVKTLTL